MTPLTDAYPVEASLKPLAFTLDSAADGIVGSLAGAGDLAFSDAAWQRLATRVAEERTLTPFPAHVLRERWERGYAAALAVDGEIAAYVSVAPVLDAITRAALQERWTGDTSLPHVDVYESLTGWTSPAARKHGISLALRRALLARIDGPCALLIGFTAGSGASPVLSRLGWQVLPWREISFVGSLIENSTVDCRNGVLNGWRVDGLKPYNGPGPLTFRPDHDWNAYCHFWLSKPALGRELDSRLARLNGDDLCLWRETWGRVVERVLLERGWVPIVLGE
jgi:hypothetical protein